MDEQAATENEDAVTEVEPTDQTPAGDEVEGHSMAISANFAIDIGGIAGTPADKLKKAQESGAPTTPTPPIR